MKTKTMKITGILLTLVMLATMLGAFTLSASAEDLTITYQTESQTWGSGSSTMTWDLNTKTLTLTNYTLDGTLETSFVETILLVGNNVINGGSYGIYYTAGNTSTLTIKSKDTANPGTLTLTCNTDGSSSYSAGIYAHYGAVTIENATVNATGGNATGWSTGIFAGTNITVTDATVNAASKIGGTRNDAIYAGDGISISRSTVHAVGADGGTGIACDSLSIDNDSVIYAQGNSGISVIAGDLTVGSNVKLTAIGNDVEDYCSYGISVWNGKVNASYTNCVITAIAGKATSESVGIKVQNSSSLSGTLTCIATAGASNLSQAYYCEDYKDYAAYQTLNLSAGTDSGTEQSTLSVTGMPSVVYLNDRFQLTVTGGSGDGMYFWETSDASIAIVDQSGNVSVIGVGDVTITAKRSSDGTYKEAAKAVTFTVVCTHNNSEHTTGTDNGDGTHSFECSVCGNTGTEDHTGGTATCVSGKLCELCDTVYGNVNENNHSFNETGLCTATNCGAQAVVKVGPVFYTSFATALENWGDGTTLTLLDDVSYDTAIKILDKNVTLDLNGYTLDMSTVNSAITVGDTEAPTGTLTIQDSGTNGTLKGKINTVVVGGVLYLNSGNLKGRIYVYTVGTANITGGSITGSYIDSEGTLNITGGVFDLGVVGRKMTTISGSPEFYSYLTIWGGTTTISGTPKLSWLKIYEGATITLNTQPAQDESWCVEMYSPLVGTFAIPGEGVELDVSRFYPDREGLSVVKNPDGSLALVCPHTSSEHTTGTDNGDGTHNFECTVCNETVTEDHDHTNGKCVCGKKATPVVTPPTPLEGMVFSDLYFSIFRTWPETTGGTLMYKVNEEEWSSRLINRKWSAGTYIVYYKVVGDENYESVDTGAFITVTILQQELDKINPTVTLSPESFVYDGTAKTPDVSIVTNLPYPGGNGFVFDGVRVTLEVNKDFTVTYSDNVNPGTATVTIQGIGNFKGTVTRTFIITCDHTFSEHTTGTDSGNGNHSYICTVCQKENLEAHTITYTDQGDGTHTSTTCEICGFSATNQPHVFADGACTFCKVPGGYCGAEGDGTNLSWTFTDGTLTIYGTGAMADYTYETTPWWESRGTVTTVVVKEGVTALGDYSFDYCTNLTSVSLPAGLLSIGKHAFAFCTSLVEVSLPEGLQFVDRHAFAWCSKLETMKLPNSVTTLGTHVFYSCTALKSVTLSTGITSIPNSLFASCPALTTLEIPAGVTFIDLCAFDVCESLTTIILPEGLQHIGDAAFNGCGLTEITIPKNVEYIGSGAFRRCDDLTTVTIHTQKATFADNAFADSSAITTVNVPCSWNENPLHTFADTVTVNIQAHACTYLFDAQTHTSTTCEDCGYSATNQPHVFVDGSCTVCKVTGGYCGAEGDGTNLSWTLIDGTLTIYGEGAMKNFERDRSIWFGKTTIKKVVIADGVTTVGDHAFGWCMYLTSVELPETLISIGKSSFYLCSKLESITFPASLKSIGDYAFDFCEKLKTVNVSHCSWTWWEKPYEFGDDVTVNVPAHDWTYEMTNYRGGILSCGNCNKEITVGIQGSASQIYGLKWNSIDYSDITVTFDGVEMKGSWKFVKEEGDRPLVPGFATAIFTPENDLYGTVKTELYFYFLFAYPSIEFATNQSVYLPGQTVEINVGVGHPLYPDATDLVQPEITEITYVIGEGEPRILVGNTLVIPADAAGKTITFTVKVAKVDGCYSERISNYTVEVTKDSAIIGSSVTVGSDLTMNYYVTLGNEGLLENGKTLAMLFRLGNKEVLVDTYTVVDGQYVFALEHIAPQQMSDRIDAQLLLVDGEETAVLASHLDYSVKKNVQDLLRIYAEDTALVQLLTDLLVYGDAAQKYMGYNTEDLATNGITGMVAPSTVLPEASDRVLTKVADGNASFTSVGVWFGTANRIYVKLNTTENVTLVVKVGDTVIGTYTDLAEAILYTGDIAATDFDAIYTFELYEGETLVQTLTYSINSYAHAKQNSTNVTMAELAKALYRYGVSAEAYANK